MIDEKPKIILFFAILLDGSFVSSLTYFISSYTQLVFDDLNFIAIFAYFIIFMSIKIEFGKWYDLGKVSVCYTPDHVYHARLKKDQELTIGCVQSSMEFRERYNIDQPYFIMEFGEFSTADLDARMFAIQRDDEPFQAEAFVTCNLAQKIIVDNYIRMNKRNVPFQRFDSVDEAKEWIYSLQKKGV